MRMKWEGYVARMRERRNTYWFMVGKPAGKIQTRKTEKCWEDNIKMYLTEIG
jgi:hypothetical protein